MIKLVRPLPLEYKIIIYFNLSGRIHPIYGLIRAHKGVDIVAPEGTKIRSAGEGVVIWSGYNGKNSFGNAVIVAYPDGKLSLYAHLSDIIVKSGDFVKTGSTIGLVGNTGASSGNHLHYEVINGNQIIENRTLIDNIKICDLKILDKQNRKATGIPTSIKREDPKQYFYKRHYIWHIRYECKCIKSHFKLNEKKFSYDDKIFPGEEFGCKCYAEELYD